MKISYFSDLHFGGLGILYETWKKGLQEQNPDLIINCGDYGYDYNPRVIERIDLDCLEVAETIAVPGNHDYYNNQDKTPEDEPVSLYEKDGWLIISHPLWTNYFNENPLEIYASKRYLADFHYIPNWTPERQIEIFYKTITKFDEIIKKYPDHNIIIVTHHAPSTQSVHPRFRGTKSNNLNGSFVNQLETFILDRPQIKYWFHGHVHDGVDYQIGECRVLCHPKGYRGEVHYENYVPKVIEV